MSQAAPSPATDAAFRPLRLTGADGARIEVLPYGAHVSAWVPAGATDSRLFMSGASEYRAGVPLRGGVPVIFPQFAAHGPLVKHGFARLQAWTAVMVDEPGCRARFELHDTAASRSQWPHAFRAELEVSAAGPTLRLQLVISNTGVEPFNFTVALHTYLRVNDVTQTQLQGLGGLRYLDALRERREYVEEAPLLGFAAATDRIYFDAPAELTLIEPDRRLHLRQEGFRDTVTWNPGPAGAAAIADLQDDDWRHLLCVEAATTVTPVTLAAGAQWSGMQTLTCL